MKSTINYFKKIFFVFKEIYKAGAGVFILSMASMFLTGISPVVITYLTAKLLELLNKSLGNNNSVKIYSFIAILVGITGLIILSFAIESVKTVICSVTGLKLSHNIENIIADKFQSISRSRLDNPEFRDLHTNTITACSSEPLNLMDSLFGLVASVISLVGYAIIVLKYNVVAFLIILASTIPTIIIKRKYQDLMFRFFSSRTMQMRRILYYLSLVTEVENANEVRSYRLFPYLMQQREVEFKDYMNSNSKIAAKEILLSIVTNLIAMIGTIMVGIWLIKQAFNGELPVSVFYLTLMAMTTFVTKLLSLAGQVASTSKSMLFIDFIFQYLDEDETIDSGDKNILEKNIHNIRFENVSYKYEGTNCYSLENISFSFNTNETICLVGENGSGKTTLSKLLMGIYKQTEGHVYIDDIDIKEYDTDALRRFFGVLYQDYINYADSVSNNIGFGRINNIDDEEGIENASHVTGADKFIEKYSEGYKTYLSKMFFNDAVEPSGGQWQKLALTRALYSNGKVLVLDEPTAALDPRSEVQMVEVFERIKNIRSTVIISHRMYMTKLADRIIVLDNGKIVENGSFDELINDKKEFYSMYKLQSDSYLLDI